MPTRPLIFGLHHVGHPPRGVRLRGAFITPRMLGFFVRVVRGMGYEFTTLRRAMSDPARRWAVLTFDDGYVDNLAVALPFLRRLNVPATVFVISGDVGKDALTWTEAVESQPFDLLDWDSLRRLAAEGWEIGSHAHEHVHLDRYSAQEQRDLVAQSIVNIAREVGTPPQSFAYPYGTYDAATLLILQSLNIRNAVTTKPPRHGAHRSDIDALQLPRVSIGGASARHYLRSSARLAQAVGPMQLARGLASAAADAVIPRTVRTLPTARPIRATLLYGASVAALLMFALLNIPVKGTAAAQATVDVAPRAVLPVSPAQPDSGLDFDDDDSELHESELQELLRSLHTIRALPDEEPAEIAVMERRGPTLQQGQPASL